MTLSAATGVHAGAADDDGMSGTDRASRLVTTLLDGVGTRLAHSLGVAEQAERASPLLVEPWRSALVPAALLHDIGYNAELALAGFHPLDGARYLRDQRWPQEVCRLVAWHTGAAAEGRLRGLDAELVDEFPEPPPEPAAALAWADMTSSPCGERCSPQERLGEILLRYPPDSIVHGAITASTGGLLAAASLVDQMLAEARDADG